MPTTASEWDQRLDDKIKAAADEAVLAGNHALAEMLVDFRLAMGQWREISTSRLRALGMYGLTEKEHEAVLRLVTQSVAAETVQEARRQVERQHDSWWKRTSVKVGVVAAVVSLVLTGLGTMAGLVALLRRHP